MMEEKKYSIRYRPVILHEEFMKPRLNANQLAGMDVSSGDTEIIKERHHYRRPGPAFGKYFGVSPEIWLNLRGLACSSSAPSIRRGTPCRVRVA